MKDVRKDVSHENARLIVENAKLRELIDLQQKAIFEIEEMALINGYKTILEVVSKMRNNVKRRK